MADSNEITINRFYENATDKIGTNRGRLTVDEDGTTSIEESEFHGDGHVIHIVHVPTNSTVHFKAFLTQWNDTFSQEWESTPIYGRMDPVQTFKRTTRKISFGWDVPSGDLKEASWNFVQAEKLMQMSYPTFENAGFVNATGFNDNSISNTPTDSEVLGQQNRATSGPQNVPKRNVSIMSSPPIFRVKFSTWMADPSKNPESKTDALQAGLYGTIDSLSFSPKFSSDESGFYGGEDVSGNNNKENINVLIPKSLSFTCNFTVIHANPLGYDADTRKPRTENFPYGAQKIYRNLNSRKIRVK